MIDLPVGPGHRLLGWNNGVNRQVFGNWQISGITTIQGGTPFTVFNSSNDFSGFNQGNDRPDVVGTGPLHQDNKNPDAAFDKTYFSATPPTGRVGSSGRNQYYGPGLTNFNFAVSKNFPLGTERFPKTSRWAQKKSICSSGRTSSISLTTPIFLTPSPARAAETLARSPRPLAVALLPRLAPLRGW